MPSETSRRHFQSNLNHYFSKNENLMNLNALSLFVSVVQNGSLSKASERLNVPIATISRQITELENRSTFNYLTAKNQALSRRWQDKSFMSKCIKTSIIYCR